MPKIGHPLIGGVCSKLFKFIAKLSTAECCAFRLRSDLARRKMKGQTE